MKESNFFLGFFGVWVFCSKELETGCPARGMLAVVWLHEWMWYNSRHKVFWLFFFFLFFFCSQSPFVTTVLCSFLKTSQEGSEDLQLERKRHLFHPYPQAGGQGVGASTKGCRNIPQQSVVPTSSPLLSSDAAATGTSLQRHFQS